MKKLFLMFAAVAALFATSCVTDTTSDVAVTGGEVDVTLSVKAPGADSRATIGTGLKATDLTCAVYDHEWKYLTTKTTTFDNGSLSTTIEMRLVKGKEYNFVFWAQSPEATCYTLNFGTTVGEKVNPNVFVNYNTDVTANDDHRDAFFGNWNCTVQGTINHTVELYRPFAQINFGTSDHEVAEEFGFDVVDNAAATTTVTTRAYNTLYLATGEVDVNKEQDVTFAAAALPVDKTLETKNGNYHWLAMNYILVPEEESSLSTCKMTVAASGHSVTVEVPMAPAKRNWRTNLVGKILTEQGNLTIEIVPAFDGELPNPDDNNLVHELILTAAVGGEITLTEDVVLTQPLTIAGDVVLNLNGKTLSAELAKDKGAIINNNATLTVVGGTIKNTTENGAAVIRNNGNLVLDGVKIEGAPIGTTGHPDYAVYSVGGSLVVEEGTEIVSDRGAINLQGGADVTINGGKFAVTNAVGTRALTSHVIYAYGSSSKLTINGGDFAQNIANGGGTSVICPAGATIKVYGGNFYHAPVADAQSGCFQNYMGYGSAVDVYGGTFNDNTVSAKPYPSINNLAEGYKAIENNGLYYVVADTVDAIVSDATELEAALAAGGEVVLAGDVTYSNNKIENDAVINLNGNTFTPSTAINLYNNADLTMVGGDYEVNGGSGYVDVRPSSADGSVVVYENVHFTSNYINKTFGTSTDRLNSVVEVCAAATDAKTVVKFKNCTFDNGKVLIEGMSGKTGIVEAVFEGCTFNALTNSSPIDVMNYVTATIEVKDCTFNLVCTSGVASAIDVSPSSSTSVVLTATNNIFNAVAATPYTYDASKGETEAHNIKVHGTPANIKFISAYDNTTVTETGTVKSGIAKL